MEDIEEFDGVDNLYPAAVQQADIVVKPPEPEQTAFDTLDMDQTLAYTQKVRMKVIKAINKNLANIEDPAMFTALLKAAGDMDKAVVSRRRVGIEEEAAKTSEEQARNTAEILRSINSRIMQVDISESSRREVPTLPAELAQVDMVPGETDIGHHQLSYDGFAKGQGHQE